MPQSIVEDFSCKECRHDLRGIVGLRIFYWPFRSSDGCICDPIAHQFQGPLPPAHASGDLAATSELLSLSRLPNVRYNLEADGHAGVSPSHPVFRLNPVAHPKELS
jgi:hypothetical protein